MSKPQGAGADALAGLAGKRIRLHRIGALESRQTCRDESGAAYPGEAIVTKALARGSEGRPSFVSYSNAIATSGI